MNAKSFKNIILSAGLEKDEYDSLENELTHMNLTNLKMLSIITAGYMVVMFTLSFQNSISLANRPYFIWCLCISTGILIVTQMGLLKTKRHVLTAVYLYLTAIFFYGIGIGCTQITQTSVSFLIFIMVGPLLFYDKPIKLNLFIWIFNIVFICISLRIKTPAARETDLINGISYGLISCFLNTWSMIIKIKRVWLEKQVKQIAEIDSLTGLKNRNSMNHHSEELLKKARKTITCIYIDVNGLHRINNEQGHEAGDNMLRCLADQIVEVFGYETAYRLGGDEYILLCFDEEEEKLNQKIQELSKRMEDRHYSISTGMIQSDVKEADLSDLIKNADERMYKNKTRFYEQKGVDRRKQRQA